ncbi:MOSC domain-containing protein [Neohortaea acidophila]|uniref:MOSC domain-containing protein n=1 Tax=Neohortaea acidophila TaxID=245834 RepID=A0A6A6PPQ7_9PEZI|nr:MOSC domain-containing protein [Neohortaea acidophila]KAF2481661.1 MOSC domain-containing protein [Neohortaea acidophila]
MPSICDRNITKEVITQLEHAPQPPKSQLLEVRFGAVKDLHGEPSGIFKEPHDEAIYVGLTGLAGDEHVYAPHGGVERAVMQYDADHYADWRCESSPFPDLFQLGDFGENLVATGMTEANVCVGDLYRVGKEVVLQVSEPRDPCYKLNKRFQWPRALKRITRTGRVGWLMRVLQTGYIRKGDEMVLLERPHPQWSLLNVKRVVQGKSVPLELVQELMELDVLTETVRGYAAKRMLTATKRYRLVSAENVTSRVKHLTFELDEHNLVIHKPTFPAYSFAKIDFGPDFSISRSYSIVSGDMNRFTLGVALDDNTRGGSSYIHSKLALGDEIRMTPGSDPAGIEAEEKCTPDAIDNRIIIIGGIGVTAFLPSIDLCEAQNLPYEVHYAVRSPEDAAFVDRIPSSRLKLYAKTQQKRLDVQELIPPPSESDGRFTTRIFTCGPNRLMDTVREHAARLGYPPHLLHFESFEGAGKAAKDSKPFNVTVHDEEAGRSVQLRVEADKTLLRTLRDAGFDMTYLCERGGCGACKVAVAKGEVCHNGMGLLEKERGDYMLSCVDRAVTDIEILYD